jgi:hypothetical protein
MGFTGQTFQNKNVVEDLIIEIEAEGKDTSAWSVLFEEKGTIGGRIGSSVMSGLASARIETVSKSSCGQTERVHFSIDVGKHTSQQSNAWKRNSNGKRIGARPNRRYGNILPKSQSLKTDHQQRNF